MNALHAGAALFLSLRLESQEGLKQLLGPALGPAHPLRQLESQEGLKLNEIIGDHGYYHGRPESQEGLKRILYQAVDRFAWC